MGGLSGLGWAARATVHRRRVPSAVATASVCPRGANEDGPTFQAHTKAVNWVRGRWVKVCGAYWRMHSNGVPYVAKSACSKWYAS
ncbi:hypothetical protein GCM10010300_47770 [Streptomyces olivaceoviridis]|nr:hypothetical protein GCM10010300_47770 [Streptomyces olivaceoviridis]